MRRRRNARDPHLTLTGVLKTPIHVQEVERTRKRKRTTLEVQREATPTTEEEVETEERGGRGFEDYPKQPMLSLRAEEDIMPA